MSGAGRYQAHYALLGYRALVESNSARLIEQLDRLNCEFPGKADPPPHARYVVTGTDGGRWVLSRDGAVVRRCTNFITALIQTEWHLVQHAVQHRPELLQFHAAALAGPTATVLVAGASGLGKTTLAMASALGGLRLYADDVVFLDPGDCRPIAFPRSPHLHDDAFDKLRPLGLAPTPDQVLRPYLCASALRPWPAEPGPPLGAIVLPERPVRGGPLALEPVTQAEAAIQLLRLSENLRRYPRAGLDLMPRLMVGVGCFRLRWNEDLATAARLVGDLVRA